jgi:hypothetical protein
MPLLVTSSEKEKIIYQYRLLKRIRPHPVINLLYIATALLWVISVELLGETTVWVWAVGAIIGWLLLPAGVTFALLSRESEFAIFRTRYGWQPALPWFGYVPVASVPFRQYRRITMHLLLVGGALTGLFLIWMPLEAALVVGFLYLWSILPRLVILLRMNRSARADTIISFQGSDVGLYSS